MKIPSPGPGLVICYSFLWRDEADRGHEEGRKDRPAAVVAVLADGRTFVLPITHAPPRIGTEAIEIPAAAKRVAGLDDEPAWIVLDQFNSFTWPGHDLHPAHRGTDDPVYGRLPRGFMKQVAVRFADVLKRKKARRIDRD